HATRSRYRRRWNIQLLPLAHHDPTSSSGPQWSVNKPRLRKSTLLIAATLGFGVLYLAGAIALGTTPEPGDSGQTVAAWFRDHGGNARAWPLLLTLSAPFFAIFVALVRERLPSPHRDVFFFGAIAFAAETAVQGWFWAGMAWHA